LSGEMDRRVVEMEGLKAGPDSEGASR
jgi:hypothetical protein